MERKSQTETRTETVKKERELGWRERVISWRMGGEETKG